MFGKLVYLIAVFCLAAGVSFSQEKTEKISTQTDKQKVAVVVPSATVDDRVSLIEGRVTFVYDGDTISVETIDGKIYSIWMKAIDAPESKQDYGKKSRKKLAELLEGKDVKVIIYKKGLYDRYIGSVYLNGEDVGLKQVESGMAWHFKQFGYEQTSEERKKYAQAQQAAQTARLGLWEDKDPIAPWDYRSGKAESEKEKNNASKEKKNAPLETASSSTSSKSSSNSENSETNSSSDRKYILGPRGGCYYVSESGRKVYVQDKSLCVKP